MSRLIALLIFTMAAIPAHAQVFTPARRPIAADQRARGLTDPPRANGLLLTQLTVTDGTTKPELSIQAADLYLGNDKARVYLRSSLQLEAEEAEADDAGGTAGPEATDDATKAVKDRIRSALLDPYGGLLYIAGGGYLPIGDALKEQKKPHGLFLDVRGGVRAVQLSAAEGNDDQSVGAFATGSIGIQFQSPVWTDPNQSTEEDAVGDFIAGLSIVGNRVMDDGTTDLFTGDDHPLEKLTGTVQLHVGLNLKGVAQIILTGNPWSSSKALGKRWTIGLNVLRDDAK